MVINDKLITKVRSRLSLLRLYCIDLVILIMVWGGFYRCTLANSDTLFGEISKEATLDARLENFRWMGYVGDGLSYLLHYYPYEHQKLSLGLFLVVMAAALLLTQMTFMRVLADRLNSAWDQAAYIGVTSLCYANVLIAELFYFTESYLIFKMAMLFAMLGCLLYSRQRYISGTFALLIAPMFYQMSCVHAALVLCTLAVLEEKGEFSIRLVRKEILYIGAPMCAGFLNYITGPYLLPVISRITQENNGVAKHINDTTGLFHVKTLMQIRDLYVSALHLMMPVCLPLIFSLSITIAVIYSLRRNHKVLLTYIIYKVVALFLMLVLQLLSDPFIFTARTMWVFYVMQAMNAIIALYCVDCHRIRHGIYDVCIGYVLVQVFFIQIIITNRSVSETLDRMNANRILDAIESYEQETGEEITTLSFDTDARSRNAYDQVHYSNGAINCRLYSETAYTLVETIARERGRSFEQVSMDPLIYEEYYAGHDWNELNIDEQAVIRGDTWYMCVY